MKYKELDEATGIENTNQTFRIIWEQFLNNWYWFVIGLIISWSLAFFKLRYAERYYNSEAKVLIKEDVNQSGSELNVLTGKGLGRLDIKPNIIDQTEVMSSRRLVGKVIKKLQLNVNYYVEGRVKKQEIYWNDSPIQLRLISEDTTPIDLDVTFKPQSDLLVQFAGKSIQTAFGKTLKLGSTEMMFLPRNNAEIKPDTNVKISIVPLESAINRYKAGLNITAVEEASVIRIGMIDNIPERAKKFIDELIDQYNIDAINDKKLVGEKTTKFIEDRLTKVSEDLQLRDKNVETFKKENQVIDLPAQGSSSLGQATGNHAQMLNQSNQLSLINYMEDYLRTNQNELLPENIGLGDATVSSTIQKYNELTLARMDMLKYSTANSQIVRNLDEQINEVKNNLHSSLSNYKKTVQITLSQVENEGNRIDTKIARFPTQEMQFKDISRQQQIVEALYLFLLQKREENEITNSATPSAIKVVDYAYSNGTPVSPDSRRTYITATAFGVLIPFGLLYILFLLNNKVKNRKEVEKTGISIIGEVPASKIGGRIIDKDDHSFLAESFRILRTNMGYYLLNKKDQSKSIFVTSTVSGEGKTFIACNLAVALSASGKFKTLILGADIRNPKLLKYFELNKHQKQPGITQYLSDSELNLENLVICDEKRGVDIIHSGVLVPNPSELLMNHRFMELILEAKKKYDYIIVDTAPINLVTDTQLIADNADLFLYVIRIDFSDKHLLEIPKNLHQTNRLPNMAIVLNDVGSGKGFGYNYDYGYGGDYYHEGRKQRINPYRWFNRKHKWKTKSEDRD